MTTYEAYKLKKWLEYNYGEESMVKLCEVSFIAFNKSFIDRDGLTLHTDGIIERNDRDAFANVNILGFTYIVLCYHGVQFQNSIDPRIVVYANENNKLKGISRKVAKILDSYST